MNAAGYRYGASDQAFYIPAVVRHLQPLAYPRDAPLIDSQARLTVVDEIVATGTRVTGVSLQWLFLALYLATLGLLLGGALRIGSHLYRSAWAVAALAAAMTLRHAIAKTGANTLEGYFHPRQLAFALGLWAVASFLDRRDRRAIVLLIAAAAIHSTTAIWFGVWLGAAAFLGRPAWRRALGIGAGLAVIGGCVAVWRGVFAAKLVTMDPQWLAAVGEKDLFPLSWPLDAWVSNLVTVPIVLWSWRARQRAGLTMRGETALALGAMALVVLFVCWLPFNAARVALAVQLQLARVFWMLDVLATVYLVWWLAEGTAARPAPRRAMTVAVLILAGSLARGAYTCFVQFPERRIFAVDVQNQDWRDAMAFVRATGPATGWLADPIHAALYGSSLRASGYHDVMIEILKDRAIAMYDRQVAMRIADRLQALDHLAWDTPDGARGLARRFELDYLIIDRDLDLPLAHRSGSLFIYKLR